MAADNETSRFLKLAKIMQAFFIFAILVYAYIIFWILPRELAGPVFSTSDYFINVFTIALSIVAVYSLVFGFFLMPRRMLKTFVKAYKQSSKVLLYFDILRGGLFESIAICGLILGILGAGEQITISFMVVSAAALILTFPTEERWLKMQELINGHSEPE